MVQVRTESLLNKIATKWLSRIILRSPNRETLMKYREIEKIKLKMVHISSHLSFNETCIHNKLLPTYTDINLHDDASPSEPFVQNFRRGLIERQIAKQKLDLIEQQNNLDEKITVNS